ncbi:MAG: phosphate ABC transporter substrate-binding protein PstS [Labilithrix sp.]|nr:phosphate ABC transporter substrate-binding protein PstS [Labilithrix sp.]MCW5810840.1 phosphate ABC transporter substrate-binding protein PstS [Labilithrix sp.]
MPFPLYTRWAAEYSGARVNYQPLGSGAGVRQVSDGVVDFGATDEPMSDAQLKEARADLVHVPMTIGAVVIAFNVAGVSELRLTPDVIADVFRGTIAKWDDPRLAGANPGVALPAADIAVVHRADGSGTSAAFTAYLAKSSEGWRAEIGAGAMPRFPVGVGVRGNDGVTAYVKATPCSIGYVELAYARQSHLAVAHVRNRAGKWMTPDLDSLDRAARSALGRVPPDLRVSIVDAEDDGAYPIAALSFLVLPRDARERARAEALSRFVWWALHDGQRYAAELDYAPLPPEIVTRAEVVVRGLRAEGRPL